MGLGACLGIIKYLLVIVNLIFWITGLATVALAVWMLVDQTFYVSMAQDTNNYYISTYLLLAAGVLLVIVAFLGCCGAFRENSCLLVSFFCLLLIILVAEIAAVIWAHMHGDTLEPVIRNFVKTTVRDEYRDNENRRATFDAIQHRLQCCGADGPSDWIADKEIAFKPISDGTKYNIPKSCCRENVAEEKCESSLRVDVGGIIDPNLIYQEGCITKVAAYIRNNINIFVGIGFGIMSVEVLGLVFSLILTFAINKGGRYKA
ncbi:CD9 antigen-like [Onthophagus taurus]|uniref:CD9 antigen-like n=1 Tax=Onthophagus taurus TaxID=166361 RepID=UPI000C1FDC3D|nr:CD9 antigen-like [Onthophagus taurus]